MTAGTFRTTRRSSASRIERCTKDLVAAIAARSARLPSAVQAARRSTSVSPMHCRTARRSQRDQRIASTNVARVT